jgi:NADH-quinone oxidoreductase subunit L
MVAAGVYLFARLHPFFSLSPVAMEVILAIGTISMLLASTMAMVSRDIKRVWAYSTISQLGFMIMALAAGAWFAGVFHLATHAGFKALLFLCSGVFIHTHETNDIFELGRLGSRRLKVPTFAIIIGAAALSGLPPLSGYFSKEAIMAGLATLSNPVWLWAGLLGVFLTAYYSFRVIFIVFLPPRAAPATAPAPQHARGTAGAHHEGAAYQFMAWPLVILALATIFAGFGESLLERFLSGAAAPAEAPSGAVGSWVGHAALALAAVGVLTAWIEFGRPRAARIGFVERLPRLHGLFEERWHLDDLYLFLVTRVVDRGIAALFHKNDNEVIDGALDGLCKGTVESGRIASILNSGMIQYRLLISFAVLVFLLLYIFF